MKILNRYKNGNYDVTIFDDGTKIRNNNLSFFDAEFPENIDLKITNYCNKSCPMCHEGSNQEGKHSDLLNTKFINTLVSGTELAIGGGMVTSHPDLVPFLHLLKAKGIIANITIHQEEFMDNLNLIEKLVTEKLIYGLGVSFHHTDTKFLKEIKKYPNAVIHLINGIHQEDTFKYLANNSLKILILGYKELRRGNLLYQKQKEVIDKNKIWLKNNLKEYLDKFKVISFDNLAIKQLEVQKLLTKSKWDEFYMGDDGEHTMYIDLVEKQFAQSSTNMNRYDILDDIRDMFKKVKEGKK